MALKKFMQTQAMGEDTWTEVIEFNFAVFDIENERGRLSFAIRTWDSEAKANMINTIRYEIDHNHPMWADVLQKIKIKAVLKVCEDVLLVRPEFGDAVAEALP